MQKNSIRDGPLHQGQGMSEVDAQFQMELMRQPGWKEKVLKSGVQVRRIAAQSNFAYEK